MRFYYARLRHALVAVVCCMLSLGAARAQTPGWSALTLVPDGRFNFRTTDAAGNVFVAGKFFNQITLGATTLTSTQSEDGFVAKWSPASNSFVWAQKLAIGSIAEVRGIAVSAGNVYVVGSYMGTVTFGSTTLTSSNGELDGFVTKLVDAGTSSSFGWTQALAGAKMEIVTGIAANGTSVYVTGIYNSPTLQIGTTSVPSASTSPFVLGVFVAKLTDAGATTSPAWTLTAGGQETFSTALVARGAELYIGGGFSGQSRFGSLTRTSLGARDAFVAKITDAGPTGSFAWVQQAGGGIDATTNALALSGSNVFLTGFYQGAAQFGSTTLTNTTNSDQYFVAKLAEAGTGASFSWARGLGADGYIRALAARGSGVYLGGNFGGASLQLGSIVLTSSTNSGAAFVTRMTDAGPTGNFDWALTNGGSGWATVNALEIQNNTVQLAGTAGAGATFGSQTLPTAAAFLTGLADPLLSTNSKRPLPGLALYPQPARDQATISLPAGAGYRVTISLRNSLGQLVRREEVRVPVAGLRHALNLATLAPGLYMVQVETDEAAAVRPLLVQ